MTQLQSASVEAIAEMGVTTKVTYDMKPVLRSVRDVSLVALDEFNRLQGEHISSTSGFQQRLDTLPYQCYIREYRVGGRIEWALIGVDDLNVHPADMPVGDILYVATLFASSLATKGKMGSNGQAEDLLKAGLREGGLHRAMTLGDIAAQGYKPSDIMVETVYVGTYDVLANKGFENLDKAKTFLDEISIGTMRRELLRQEYAGIVGGFYIDHRLNGILPNGGANRVPVRDTIQAYNQITVESVLCATAYKIRDGAIKGTAVQDKQDLHDLSALIRLFRAYETQDEIASLSRRKVVNGSRLWLEKADRALLLYNGLVDRGVITPKEVDQEDLHLVEIARTRLKRALKGSGHS